MKLTQRDKMLLTVVILAIVWALGIVFLIKPKIDEVGTKNDELKTEQTNLSEAEKAVEAAKTIKEDCNKALKEAQEGAKNFFDVPKAYEAENYLAEVLAGGANGEGKIDISSLNITGPAAISLTTYNPEIKQGIDVPLNEYANISGATTSTVDQILENAANSGETLGCYNYTVTFSATRENLMKFLTNIKTTANGNSLIVTSLNISDEKSEDSVDNKVLLEGTMGFSLYFVEKLEGANVDEVIEQQLEEAGVTEDTEE